jgi:serine/threonine protein kinase
MILPAPIHIDEVDMNIQYPHRPTVIIEGDKAYKILEGRDVNDCIKYQRVINKSDSIHLQRATNVYLLSDHILLEYERLDRCLKPSDLTKGVIDQIFQCLEDLHSIGISHGDIHLNNFMFKGDVVVIIDYVDMCSLWSTDHIGSQLIDIADTMTDNDDRQYFLSKIVEKYPTILYSD